MHRLSLDPRGLPAAHVPLAALLAVACAACGTVVPPAPTPPPVPTAARQADLETGLITLDVLFPLEPDGPKPTVVLPAGTEMPVVAAGGVGVWYRIDWSRLDGAASFGVPENATAGQPPLAASSPATIGEPFFHRVAAAADALLPRILDWLETLPEVDPERIGLAGVGEDGIVALAAAARDSRVAVVAAPFACGDWEALARDSPRGLAGAPLALDPGYAAWLRAESPLGDPARLVPTPILLAERPDDPLVPPSCVEASAAVLLAAYARAGVGERVARRTLAGDAEAREAAFAWIERWLFGRRAGAGVP